MSTRITSAGPPTYVTALPTAARTTATPDRPFQQLLTAGSNAVVQGAEQIATRLPGGPLLAAAMRPQQQVSPSLSARSPEGATQSPDVSGGTAGTAVAGGSNVDGVLSQSADQNLYFLELQERISQESRAYSAMSNVLKARHDTVKNAIGNIR